MTEEFFDEVNHGRYSFNFMLGIYRGLDLDGQRDWVNDMLTVIGQNSEISEFMSQILARLIIEERWDELYGRPFHIPNYQLIIDWTRLVKALLDMRKNFIKSN